MLKEEEALTRENDIERQKRERDERMQERDLKHIALEMEQKKEQSILKLPLLEKQIELAKIMLNMKDIR